MDYIVDIDVAFAKLRAANILQVFKSLSPEIEKLTNIPQNIILDQLIECEANRSSAIGNGVSVPALQNERFKRRFVCIASLDRPVHLDTPDSKPVDLIAILLSPEKDGPVHLRGLSRLTRLLKNEELCDVLRNTEDPETMKALFVNPDGWLMAA